MMIEEAVLQRTSDNMSPTLPIETATAIGTLIAADY